MKVKFNNKIYEKNKPVKDENLKNEKAIKL